MQKVLRQRFELPIVESQETVELFSYTLREPETFGAKMSWGQVEDLGATMLISAELAETELARIPEQHRRGITEDVTVEVERRTRQEQQRAELLRGRRQA